MGQRHQLFVIAKIKDRYRCLCAIHHQWLYGLTAIRRCLDLLKIFGAPDNRLPIEQELLAASKQDSAFWDQEVDDSTVHFPFIATCLVLGASFNAKEAYYHSVNIEPFGMQFDEGDNNDGITIFDITKPSRVRYCFVDFQGIESELEVQLMTSLPAHVYLNAYYPDTEHQMRKASEGPLNELKKFELVDVAALQSTWPEGEWEEPHEEPEAISMTELERELPSQMRTLTGQSMDRLIDSLMDEPDNLTSSILLEAEHLRSFLPRLRHRIYEQASTLNSSEVTSRLLIKALEGEASVDLSPFTQLSTTIMSTVITELQNRGQIMNINLSNMNFDGEDLMKILSTCSALRALYLLETPGLPLESLLTTIKELQIRVHDVYHTDLFRKAYMDRNSGWSDDEEELDTNDAMFSSVPVVKVIWVSLSSQEKRPIDWSKLARKTREPSYWSADPTIGYGDFGLGDAQLSPTRLMTGLLNVFAYAAGGSSKYQDIGTVIASSFAAGKSSIKSSSTCQIGPLSPTLFNERRHLEAIKANLNGKFAVVVIDDCFEADDQESVNKFSKNASQPPIKGVRYAFVTRTSGKDGFDVLDVPQFLDRLAEVDPLAFVKSDTAQELTSYWAEQVQDLGAVGFCAQEEALAIAEEVLG